MLHLADHPTARRMAGRALSTVELVVAIVAFAIIAVGSYITYDSFIARTDSSAAGLELRQLAASVQQYEMSRGFFPSTVTEMTNLEPKLGYTNGVSESSDVVSIGVDQVSYRQGLAVLTDSGECLTYAFGPSDGAAPVATARFTPDVERQCSAVEALSVSGQEW